MPLAKLQMPLIGPDSKLKSIPIAEAELAALETSLEAAKDERFPTSVSIALWTTLSAESGRNFNFSYIHCCIVFIKLGSESIFCVRNVAKFFATAII